MRIPGNFLIFIPSCNPAMARTSFGALNRFAFKQLIRIGKAKKRTRNLIVFIDILIDS